MDIDLKNLEKLLQDHQTGMSDFQDDYFVTARAGGTVYGQYKQALRETYRRFRSLRDLIYGEHGSKLLDIEIEELQEQYDEFEGREKDKLEIKLKHKIMMKEESDRAIKDTYREFMRFYQQACLLKEKIGDITPESRRELELDMWIYKAKETAAWDMFQSGKLTQRTIEFVSAMPKKVRSEIYDLVFRDPQRVIDEYIGREDIYALDFEDMDLPKLDMGKIEKLLDMPEGKNELRS